MGDRPDILFLFSDQHARSVSGAYGDPLGATPHLDALAAQGVTFDNAYCPSPICTPSRMSLLTGRWPHEQSCWTLDDMLASDLPTYAHSLGAAGYRTISVGRMHSIGPDQLHGFSERLVGDCGPNWMGVARQRLGPLVGAQGPSGPGPDGLARSLALSGRGQSGYEVVDDATTQAACDRLAELGRARQGGDDTPFCMVAGFILPHCPFVARAGDYDRFEGRVPAPRLPKPAPGAEPEWVTQWRAEGCTEAADAKAVERARAAYWALVHAMDVKIGKILDALRGAGLGENTLIIYASDHGEHAGERGLWWKNTMYEESAGVPLILSWPGHLPEGSRCRSVCNLVDLGATMISAAGAPALPRSRGRDLLPRARAPDAGVTGETFSEYVTDLSSPWTGKETKCIRMIRSGRWKYVHAEGDRPMLFDLVADPDEIDDLWDRPEHAGLRDELKARLLAGWNPAAIRAEVDARCAEKEILREWGRRTRPPSTAQFLIEDSDNWLD
ncbi:sulfatase-like hydrolase/transferase [Frigidibacter sp. ROC022]|uniref:sulfatase-like hydrolase/transferase n=1 Tax=Frigidibacter sp. ROC022 TaxID=2971796 RepID=UPI00215A9FD3|nr:sulfatase-like hydrolase/transferase [Frigidibacter sp. ROC022]MCR8725776.1 sulfatase-like hydrolase/transferase [Frigidibacter sp. ROC022]